jgi:hypothetical protein
MTTVTDGGCGRVSLGFDPVDEELGKRSPVLPDALGPFFDQASLN